MAWVKALMDVMRIVLTVTRPFSIYLLDYVYRLIYGAKKELPPIRDRLLLIPATRLAEVIRKKQLKAVTLMEAYIGRIQELEPLVNGCVDTRFEEALEEARKVDEFVASGRSSEKDIASETPLLGVPFSCKEAIGVKGMIQTCGIYAARNRRAPRDGDAPSLYRAAGAIPVVATNVPELCTWWESASIAYGTTYNPYDNIRCPGGSSGGEAAVLSYAGSVIGIGNDLAGSIRVPSAFCGIYGLKPSPGKISNRGDWPDHEENDMMDSYVTTGPMCRYVQDLPLLASVLSQGRIKIDTKVDFKTLKVYYMEQFPNYLLKSIPDVKVAIRKAVKYFKDTFDNRATLLTIPELKYAMEIWESKLLEADPEGPPFRDYIVGPDGSLLLEFLKALCRSSEHTIPAIYYGAIERRSMNRKYRRYLSMYETLKAKLDEILEGSAVLLIPTHPETAPHHLMTIPKYANQAYTAILSVLCYPSVTVPVGLSGGLPIGMQVVAKTDNDHLCLWTATELDKCFGGWTPPSKVELK